MRLFLISSYIALSPVYWLPWVSQADMAQLKVLTIAVLLASSVKELGVVGRQTGLIVFSLAVSALCAYISLGTHTDSLVSPLYRSFDFIEPICWMLIISSVPERDSAKLIQFIQGGLAVFFVISLYPLAARLGFVPDIAVPDDSVELLGERFSYLIGVLTVSTAGFNTGHTGWGPAVAFGCLALASIMIHTRDRSLGEQKSAMAVLIVGTICVAAVGARAATLALVIVAAIWFLSSSRARIALGVLAVLVAALSMVTDFSALLPERLVRMTAAGDLFSVLDDLSTGRLSTYVSGVLDFVSSPFTGVGTDDARVVLRSGLEIVSIHNVWLRMGAEGGVILLAPALWTMWLIVSAASKVPVEEQAGRGGPNGRFDFRYVIGLGLLLSLVEPGVIFGSFNNNVLFWTAVAIAARGYNVQFRAESRPQEWSLSLKSDQVAPPGS